MDFLTRLAQRLIGELPAVQPRLPLLFEPAAGSARAVEESGEMAISFVRAREKLTTSSLSTLLAATAWASSAFRDAPPSLDPLHPPVNIPAQARLSPSPAPPLLAPDGTGDVSGGPSNETSAREIIQPVLHLAPHLRAVPVAIRPIAPTAAPPLSTTSRRGAIAREMPDEAQPGQIVRTDERPQGPPTIHVHIGRVDVRAVMPSAAAPRPAARPAAPRASLEDYLSGRKGGSQP